MNTYYFDTKQYDKNKINYYFKYKETWKEFDDKKDKVIDYYYKDSSFDEKNKKIINSKKNIVNYIKNINLNRVKIYEKLYNYGKKYIVKQYFFNINDDVESLRKHFSKNKKWIVEKVSYDNSPHIILQKFNKFKSFIETNKKLLDLFPENEMWTIKEHQENILAIDKNKYKVLIWLIIYGNKGYILKKGKLYNIDSTYLFPNYLNNYLNIRKINKLTNQIQKICYYFKKSIIKSCNDDVSKCYQVFELKFIITDDYNMKLINYDYADYFETNIFYEILDVVFEKILDKKYPSTKHFFKNKKYIVIE